MMNRPNIVGLKTVSYIAVTILNVSIISPRIRLKYNVGSLHARRRSLYFRYFKRVKILNLSFAPCKELQYRLFYTRAALNTSSNYSAEYEYRPEYFAVAEADTE